ncbi:hypothetical protein SIAM614_11963 [Stappia aggregata IAM 12614]|uniref:Uncharacterized protein n=1 Tax=Roseibium aggregatum (strain ATCC 25650 / DSM 13394 / JCM 20685 / NBRC 16684 / NCIMB 2208 / IAM 12614 / B1) TaxID=384765 RepID=A0NTT0_ROSAI|nr:hypothetical protein SIAM614_11963 [Stappia aggregata IAM 12614] [Roseibium aggregatum IAM 12614]
MAILNAMWLELRSEDERRRLEGRE